MKYAIVYSSLTGNTKLLATTIRDSLPKEDCIYFGSPAQIALKAKRVYVGFWTNQGCCDEKTIAFLKEITTQEIFLFGTAGFGNDTYYSEILKNSCRYISSSARLVGSFMCQGKMPLTVRTRYEKMLSGVNESEKTAKINEKIANFDQALTHPDSDDLSALKKALQIEK